MPLLEIGGVQIPHVIDGADGAPVLVLAHSLGTDHHLWDPQLEALSERFQVVRYDLRGHGASRRARTASPSSGATSSPSPTASARARSRSWASRSAA